MKKNIITWIASALAGMTFVLLLNISPLARLGFTIELSDGWYSRVDPNGYKVKACDYHAEGLPFAFKRPSAIQDCTFDTNKTALLLNGLTGFGLGIGYAFISTRQHSKAAESRNIKP